VDPWGLWARVKVKSFGTRIKGLVYFNQNFSFNAYGFQLDINVLGYSGFNARQDPYGVWKSPCDKSKIGVRIRLRNKLLGELIDAYMDFSNTNFVLKGDPLQIMEEFGGDIPLPSWLKKLLVRHPDTEAPFSREKFEGEGDIFVGTFLGGYNFPFELNADIEH